MVSTGSITAGLVRIVNSSGTLEANGEPIVAVLASVLGPEDHEKVIAEDMRPVTGPFSTGRVSKHFSQGIFVREIDDLEEVTGSETEMRLTDGDVVGSTAHADVVDTDLVLRTVAIVLARGSRRLDRGIVVMIDKWIIVFAAFVPLHHSPD